LALGRKLVGSLNDDGNHDLLSVWMGQYVAELMLAVPATPSNDRLVAQRACASAILDLWSHRAALPAERRPFSSLEPIVDTLAALRDESAFSQLYRGHFARASALTTTDQDSAPWLTAMRTTDAAAKCILSFALDQALARLDRDASAWLALAKEVEDPASPDIALLQMIVGGDNERPPVTVQQRLLDDRIRNVDTLIRQLNDVKASLKAEKAK